MRIRPTLLTIGLLLAAPALSQAQTPPSFDAAQLPAIQGTVAQYSLTPRGDVDGLILTDGTEVHLPPHLGTQLVSAAKPGDAVTIHGLKARSLPVVQAMEVRNDATGATVVDNGPGVRPGPRGGGQPLEASGPIKAQLHGPRGELNGVLLQDGTIVRLPPPEAERLRASLAPGRMLTAKGAGYAGPLGRVIAAQAIGPDANNLSHVAAPPPPPPPRAFAGDLPAPPPHGAGGPPAPPPGIPNGSVPPPPPVADGAAAPVTPSAEPGASGR